MQTHVTCSGIPQGASRRIIDKVQPTIDRPAADIVLSDEPSE